MAPVAARRLEGLASGIGEERVAVRVRIMVWADLGQGQFQSERGGGGGEGRHSRRHVERDAEGVEPAHLLGDGAV